MSQAPHLREGRGVHVLLAVTVATAIVGFLTGLGKDPPQRPQPPAVAQAALAVATAPSYRQVREQGMPGRRPDGSDIARQAFAPPERPPLEPVAPQLELRAAAVQARAERRAYDGAPPTVPHPVPQGGLLPCLACHGDGLYLGGRPVPRVSHAPYSQCTQCHVPDAAPLPAAVALLPQSVGDSDFAGLVAPLHGERAGPGAPPTVPHTTHMRTGCGACHGASGREGLKTSHPWRQSCLQCHAPSAARDQMPASRFGAP